MKYLNEYKKLIDNKFEEFNKNPEEHKKELEEFIEKSINSKYAIELSKCLGNKLEYNFLKEFSKKSNIELKLQPGARFQYKNSNPKIAVLSKKYSEQLNDCKSVLINHIKLLNQKISGYQFGTYNGEIGIAFFDNKGKLFCFDNCDCTKYSNAHQRLGKSFKIPNIENFIPNSKKYKIEGCSLRNSTKTIFKCKRKLNSLYKEGINKKEIVKMME